MLLDAVKVENVSKLRKGEGRMKFKLTVIVCHLLREIRVKQEKGEEQLRQEEGELSPPTGSYAAASARSSASQVARTTSRNFEMAKKS